MKSNLHRVFTIGLALLGITRSPAFAQGALEPTGGPAPTMKTLAQIEPRTPIPADPNAPIAFPIVLSQPGSYYLARNLQVPGTSNGIEIQVGNVSLDLNGFAVVGSNAITFSGIVVLGNPNPLENISIVNGTVMQFSGTAVSANASRSLFRDLHIATTGILSGLDASGTGNLIVNCTARGSGSFGAAIQCGRGCALIGCNVSDALNGIRVGPGSTITSCNVSGTTTLGIGPISPLINPSNDGSTISNCTILPSSGGGIQVTSNCTVTGNTCSTALDGNGTGIHLTGSRNRIDSNMITHFATGILIDDAGTAVSNLVIRNSAIGNTLGYVMPGSSNRGHIINDPNNPQPWANFGFQ